MSIPSLSGQPPPLVGRERELAILRDHLAAAMAGRGSLVLIGGEAGIGKTALAETICQEATDRGALVLVGRCYDLMETPPYGPWLELFARRRWHDDLPALPVTLVQRGAIAGLANQAVFLHQVADFLIALAARRPLVLLLDDLHWADPASLDLVRSVARDLPGNPILVLATYRSDELNHPHPLYQLLPALAHASSAAALDLRPLDTDDLRALIAARYRLQEPAATPLVAYLSGRSEGNPFFASQLLRALEEDRTLVTSDGGWRLGEMTASRLPLLLRQVIDARLARLGEADREILAAAAVIGHGVPLGLWGSVAGADEEVLLAAIQRAIDARVLAETPSADDLRFVHALIREAVYEGIPAIRRRRLHGRVGEALLASPDPDPDIVAYHFRKAADGRAAAWLVRAGERARHTFAFATAIARFEESLPLLRGAEHRAVRGEVVAHLALLLRRTDTKRSIECADAAVQIAREIGDRSLAAIALYRRGVVNGHAGNYRRGLSDLESVADAIAALSTEERARLMHFGAQYRDAEALVRDNIANTLQVVGRYGEALRTLGRDLDRADGSSLPCSEPGMAALTVAYTAIGRPDDARAWSAAVRSLLRSDHEDVGDAQAMEFELSEIVLPYQADYLQERQRLADEAERAYRRATDTPPGFSSRTARVGLLVVEGEWAEADALLSQSHRAGGLPGWRLAELRLLAQLARARGDAGLAWSLIQETLPGGPATEPGDAYFLNACAFQRCAVGLALDAGDHGIARQWLTAHDRWLASGGAVLGRAEAHLLWGQWHRAIGDTRRASLRTNDALTGATEPRQPLVLLAVHRLLGELATEGNRFDDAGEHLRESLTLADACLARYERALTLLAVAALRAAMGESETARALIGDVRTICESLGALPALASAARLAERLEAIPLATPRFPAGLSAREVEVLRLVAAGLTNPQVADRLFLSPRTVGAHLRSIYNKIGVPSRAAAARWAAVHALV